MPRLYVYTYSDYTLLWDILRFAKASFFDDRTSESYYVVFKIRHSYSLIVKILMCKWSKSIGWDVSLKIIKYYSPPPIIRIRQRVALILCSQSAKNAVFLYEYCFEGGGGSRMGIFYRLRMIALLQKTFDTCGASTRRKNQYFLHLSRAFSTNRKRSF